MMVELFGGPLDGQVVSAVPGDTVRVPTFVCACPNNRPPEALFVEYRFVGYRHQRPVYAYREPAA